MIEKIALSTNYITLEALFHAYRKAKVDVCNDKNQPRAWAFVDYESNLCENLVKLQSKLCSESPDWFNDTAFIGQCGCVSKSLELVPTSRNANEAVMVEPHFFISDPEVSWERKLESGDFRVSVEFRPVALFTVEMYIVSALWVNLVGHLFDGCLSDHAAGARVRRLKVKIPGSKVGQYHVQSLGTFPPYFTAYKNWRDNGLKTIRKELADRKGVVAVTMDLASFYHNIDASFLLNDDFLNAIRFQDVYRRTLTSNEKSFTSQLIKSFETWAKQIPDGNAEGPIGIPVGPSASRIIANVLLGEFDRLIVEELEPIYYSRYVDDIFLVLRDSGRYKKGRDVFKRLERLLDPFIKINDSEITLDLQYAKNSKLIFQAKKQRVFLLKGEVGEDLLDTIKDRIDEVSSEWRLLPDLEELEKSPAAKVLSSSRVPSEEANTLRKADELSLNRLSFSILLRYYNQLHRDLPAKEWKREREGFFRFSERHVLTPPKIFDLCNYIPGLISLAVACRDWGRAQRIVRKVISSLESIEARCSDNGSSWKCFKDFLAISIAQSLETSFPFDSVTTADENQGTKLQILISKLGDVQECEESLKVRSGKFFWADLGRTPFKEGMLRICPIPQFPFEPLQGTLSEAEAERFITIKSFLDEFKGGGDAQIKARPLLFPTRPFTVAEITEVDQKCVTDLQRLHDLTWALRGAWLIPSSQDRVSKDMRPNAPRTIVIGKSKPLSRPRIALTSHLISDESWAQAAAGMPNLSAERYTALVKLTNAVLKSSVRPDYVLFPELSIPRRWLPSLSRKLRASKISLIAGVEYDHVQATGSTGSHKTHFVASEAYMYLMDNRIGYQEHCVIKQRKGFPAHHEREELRHKFGIELAPFDPTLCEKHVIQHFGHNFAVLICSELTDIRFRENFRGNIDSLFILSWNQDLESFAALVDSAALDVHCFVGLVNNRRFGDSRVRAPYKKQWKRDLVRVKGGLEDYFVTTEINLTELRQFQSHSEPPLGENALFKPFPEGFEIVPSRKQVPGSPPRQS